MIVIDWGISSFYGWGVYGLSVALQWESRGIAAATMDPINRSQVALDPLRMRAVKPFLDRSALVRVKPPRESDVRFSCLGNECLSGISDKHPSRNGVIFFEKPFSKAAQTRAREFDVIVAGSSWNADLLKSYGCGNVVTSFQGVDTQIFCPAGREAGSHLPFQGRFVIFSGGKAEPRKGQDLVIKAFRAFCSLYPHANPLLVTAWHSPWPEVARGMDLDVAGLEDRIIDVGAVPNWQMPGIYRACDVALFPNRAEGGTNLVAMECIACGVPTILSRNTGHLDLLERGMGYALHTQKYSCDGWGTSDIDEIVAALEVHLEGADGLVAGPRYARRFDAASFSWYGASVTLEQLAERCQLRAA